MNSHENESLHSNYQSSSKSKDTKKEKTGLQNSLNGEDNGSRSMDSLDFLPPTLKRVSKGSWAPLLTSHLSTVGSSIVVGVDNLAVNQVRLFDLKY
jgi:hypothetical protein